MLLQPSYFFKEDNNFYWRKRIFNKWSWLNWKDTHRRLRINEHNNHLQTDRPDDIDRGESKEYT